MFIDVLTILSYLTSAVLTFALMLVASGVVALVGAGVKKWQRRH